MYSIQFVYCHIYTFLFCQDLKGISFFVYFFFTFNLRFIATFSLYSDE